MQTTRPTMKQAKCKHPSGSMVRGIDPRFETCRACGLTRMAPVMAPWLIAYDEANPPEAPALFAGIEERRAGYGPSLRVDYRPEWRKYSALWAAARAALMASGAVTYTQHDAWLTRCYLIALELPSGALSASLIARNSFEVCRIHRLFFAAIGETLERCAGRRVHLSITSPAIDSQLCTPEFTASLREAEPAETPEPAAAVAAVA